MGKHAKSIYYHSYGKKNKTAEVWKANNISLKFRNQPQSKFGLRLIVIICLSIPKHYKMS